MRQGDWKEHNLPKKVCSVDKWAKINYGQNEVITYEQFQGCSEVI